MLRQAALCALLVTMATSAHARDWPSAGGWDVAELSDSCGMVQEYEGKGETEVAILVDLSGDVALSAKNSDWSAVRGEKYEMDYLLNGTSYGGGAAVGIVDTYKKGFVARFGPDFARDFAAGTSLKIYRGQVLVDQLSLSGTAAGMAMVRRCVAAVRADREAEEREKRRFAHIPDDPFAEPSKPVEAAGTETGAAIPIGGSSAWLSDADYPSRAQREERSGATGYRLEVGPDGRVTNCTVTKSSGHPDLDEATCRILPRRARFSKIGNGVYEGTMEWRLPE